MWNEPYEITLTNEQIQEECKKRSARCTTCNTAISPNETYVVGNAIFCRVCYNELGIIKAIN